MLPFSIITICMKIYYPNIIKNAIQCIYTYKHKYKHQTTYALAMLSTRLSICTSAETFGTLQYIVIFLGESCFEFNTGFDRTSTQWMRHAVQELIMLPYFIFYLEQEIGTFGITGSCGFLSQRCSVVLCSSTNNLNHRP